MQTFLQQLVNGVVLGATFSVVGAGFSITYGVSRILNFAHGMFAVLGSFGVFMLFDWWSLPLPLATALGPFVVLPIGLVTYYAAVRGAGHQHGALIGTFAVAIALQAAVLVIFGSRPLLLPRLINRPPFRLGGGILIAADAAMILGVTVVALAAVLVIWERTGIGRRIRATIQDPEAANLIGINIEPYRLLSFLAGTYLAALMGAFMASQFPIQSASALRLTFISFIVVIIAGLGNVRAAMVTGVILGIVQSLSALYVVAEMSVAAPYVVMVGVILVKREGLFARKA